MYGERMPNWRCYEGMLALQAPVMESTGITDDSMTSAQ